MKHVIVSLLVILSLVIFVSTIVALKKDEFTTSVPTSNSLHNSYVFISPKFQAKNNDTEAIAQEAQRGNVGIFVGEKNTSATRVNSSNIFYKPYRFFAVIGYTLLSFLLIFNGRV